METTQVRIETRVRGEATVIEFELARPITPEEAVSIAKAIAKEARKVETKLVVISGRGPIYLYAMIVHEVAHMVPTLAIFDPKLRGAIVVASHTPEYKEGQVVPLPA